MRAFLRYCVQSDYLHTRRLIPVGITVYVEEGFELQLLSRKERAVSMRKDESLAYLVWEKCLHANMIAFYK